MSKCKKCRYGVGAGVIGYRCNYAEIKGHTKLYAFAAEYAEGKPLTGCGCVAYEPRGSRRRRVRSLEKRRTPGIHGWTYKGGTST